VTPAAPGAPGDDRTRGHQAPAIHQAAAIHQAPAATFDDFAERYARFNELRDRLLPTAGWLAAQLPGGDRVVDLGCGDGLHTGRLADRYRQVLGVDISGALLAIARQRHHHPAIAYERRGVLEVSPERDGRFDGVLSVNVLHHVGPLEVVLRHIRRLVAPAGRVVVADIVDPGGWGDRGWQVEQAFAGARGFYDLAGGDPEAAADVLRLLLHPRWLDMSTSDVPPTRERFHSSVAEVFPGALYEEDLHPVMSAFTWRAPGAA
jgi:SAM-dependent methyltransferase